VFVSTNLNCTKSTDSNFLYLETLIDNKVTYISALS